MIYSRLLRLGLVLALPLLMAASSGPRNIEITIINVQAYYVAPAASGGSDSNDGLAATVGGGHGPFATLGKCQTAMQADGTRKTCYIRAGIYTPSQAHTWCGNTNAGDALGLNNLDVGETWSYYPPDGIGSAIIDGRSTGVGTGLGCGIQANPAVANANITINGLQLRNFQYYGLDTNNMQGSTFINNTIHDIYGVSSSAALGVGCAGINTVGNSVTIANNYIYNAAAAGIGLWGCAPAINMASITGNVLINTNHNWNDGGAIYITGMGVGGPVTISGNYIRDTDLPLSGLGAYGVYQDGGNNNIAVTKNVVTGKFAACVEINGSNNAVMQYNICDLDSNGTSQSIVVYGQSSQVQTMTGNVWSNNIVVLNDASAGGGYVVAGIAAPVPLSISNNAYWNYTGPNTNVKTTGPASVGSDSKPTFEDPQLSCWAVTIAGGSPVFSPPVSFTNSFPTSWGLPDFTIPQTGTPTPTAPSWPHSC
jgi:hypothetical protein